MVGSDFSSMLVYFTGDAVTTGGLVVLHLGNGSAHLFKNWQFVELCPIWCLRNTVDSTRESRLSNSEKCSAI